MLVGKHAVASPAGDLADDVEVFQRLHGVGRCGEGKPGLPANLFHGRQRTFTEYLEDAQRSGGAAPQGLHVPTVSFKKVDESPRSIHRI